MQTTLYNHAEAGTKEKPLMPNIILKGLFWLCENMFFEECEYLVSHYSLTSDQKRIFQQIKIKSTKSTTAENISKS